MKKYYLILFVFLLSGNLFAQRHKNFTSIPNSIEVYAGGPAYTFPTQPTETDYAPDFLDGSSEGGSAPSQGFVVYEAERFGYSRYSSGTSVSNGNGFSFSTGESVSFDSYSPLQGSYRANRRNASFSYPVSSMGSSLTRTFTLYLFRYEDFGYADQGGRWDQGYNASNSGYTSLVKKEDQTTVNVVKFTAPNQTVCYNSGSINLKNIIDADSYSWNGGSGNFYPTTTAGTKTITATKAFDNGNAIATFTITVDVAADFTFDNGSGCKSQGTLNLAGLTSRSTTFSGSYVSGSGFSLSSAPVGNHQVTATYTNGNGCQRSKTATITVLATPTANAGSNIEICYNDSDFSISGTAGNGSGSWSGTGISSGGNVDVSALSTGANTVTFTVSNGSCSVSDTRVITKNAAPTFTFNNLPTVCTNSPNVNLQNYTTENTSFSGPYVSGTSFNPPSSTGSYTITASRTVNGCTWSTTKSITVNAAPTVDAGSNFAGCRDAADRLLPHGSGEEWDGTGVIYTGGKYYFRFSAANLGSNPLTKFKQRGTVCEATDQITATVYALPNVSLANSPTYYPYDLNGNKVTTFDLRSFGLTPSNGGTFETGSAGWDDNIDNSNLTVNTSGLDGRYNLTFSYTYSDGNGCENTASSTLYIRGLSVSKFIIGDAERCGSGSVTMTGEWNNALSQWWKDMYQYYDVVWLNSNDDVVWVGKSYTTPTLNETRSYWVTLRDKSTGRLQNRKEVKAIINQPESIDIGPDLVMCDPDNETVDLTNLEPSGYTGGNWSSNVSGLISGNAIIGANRGSNTQANITYTVTDNNGCTTSDELIVRFGSTLTVSAGTDNFLIRGYENGVPKTSFDLTQLGFYPSNGNFTCVNDTDFNDAINNSSKTVDLSGAAFDVYQKSYQLEYTVTDGNGCSVSDIVTVILSKPSADVITTIDGSVCQSGVVELEAITDVPGAKTAWFTSEQGVDQPEFVGGRYTTTSITSTKTLWVALYNDVQNVYGKRKAVTANVYPLPVLNVGGPVTICDLDNGEYDLKDDEPQDAPNGTWSSPDIFIDNGIVRASERFGKTSITATYTFTNENNCTASVNKQVNFGSPLEISAGENQEVCLVNNGNVVNSFELNSLAFFPSNGVFRTDDELLDNKINNSSKTVDVSDLPFSENREVKFLYEVFDTNAGCIKTDSVFVTFSKLGNEDEFITVENGKTCGAGRVNLTASTSTGLTLKWFNQSSGGTAIGTGNSFETPSISTTTTYYVGLLNNETGCVSVRKPVIAEVAPSFEVTVPLATLNFCNVNNSTSLTSYVSPQGGEFVSDYVSPNGTIRSENITGDIDFNVSYSFTNQVGCTDTKSFTVSVGISNVNVEAGSSLASCVNGGILTLNGAPSNGIWRSNDGGVQSGINNTRSELDINGLAAGSYMLYYDYTTDQNCIITDSTRLTLYARPSAPARNSSNICGSGVTTLSIESPIDGYTYRWYNDISDEDYLDEGIEFLTETLTTSRNYYVEAVNENGCASIKTTMTANVNPFPVINLGEELYYCDNQVEVDLSQIATHPNGSWSGPGVIGDKFFGYQLERKAHVLTYTVVNTFGCSATETLIINLGAEAQLNVTEDIIEVGEAVTFSLDQESLIDEVTWFFGDGLTSQEVSPTHYYYNSGMYDVRVNVKLTNDCGGNYVFNSAVEVIGNEPDIVLSSDKEALEEINLAPNPTSGHVYINNNLHFKIEAYLINPLGKIVSTKTFEQLNKGDQLFDLSYLNEGLYILKLVSKEEVRNIKILKK